MIEKLDKTITRQIRYTVDRVSRDGARGPPAKMTLNFLLIHWAN